MVTPYKILSRVNSPADLKKLNYEELDTLADEIRDHIVEVVSKNGGHLASSLGTVEITIALYRVFNPPVDKIIWDVGHQAYAHKILTGRKNRFKTLRQYRGISGFLKPDESKYDAFGAGHTSTSISAAMGFAMARDLAKKNNKVIAVIGDASIAGGMSFEAINHIGHEKTDLLVVLVDTEMSISPTVGAMSGYMNKIITGKGYNEFQQAVKTMVEKMPATIGAPLVTILKHVGEGIKGMYSQGALFEELGFRYFGPIGNGHNIKTLVETFEKLKDIKGPKIIHIITKKGKGYQPAEKKPTLFHGIGPFDRVTGEPVKSPGGPVYSKFFSDELVKIASINTSVIAIVAAMIEGNNLNKFKKLYPARFFDVGIAEEHAVTFAAGLAKQGFKPFVAIYSTFIQRAIDQIIHDVALQKLPVVFVLDRAGLVGEDGPTHHGIFDIVFMKMIPGMVVMAPSSGNELQRMTLTASMYREGPCSIRFPRGSAEQPKRQGNLFPVRIGRAKTIRKGTDATVVCLGPVLYSALEAAERLKNTLDIKLEVIDARFAKPVDKALITASAARTKVLLTVEEGAIEGGFGQSVMRIVQRAGIKDLKTRIMGIPDRFIEHGPMEQLRSDCGLSARGIEKAVLELLNSK
ncbi:MAG: 1-deoxy-D-xylulose-5-phosphate synthase [Spirochaetia bacterium]|nr:1-deoxy-D-xylulose-5-phosphate synthase [Spirochaetia bacterium]